jgi:hypothetical protein
LYWLCTPNQHQGSWYQGSRPICTSFALQSGTSIKRVVFKTIALTPSPPTPAGLPPRPAARPSPSASARDGGYGTCRIRARVRDGWVPSWIGPHPLRRCTECWKGGHLPARPWGKLFRFQEGGPPGQAGVTAIQPFWRAEHREASSASGALKSLPRAPCKRGWGL